MIKYMEFQAVVLAGGKGSRMTELTADKPKCLLPIGNVPMIWYPLKLLERAGFNEAIVIVTENIKNDVTAAIDKLKLGIKLEFIGICGSEELGTADSIRFISDKLHRDFIVVTCDLIADIDITELVNSFRKHKAGITALMLNAPKVPNDFVTPGPVNRQRPETDLIGIDNLTNRLVFIASASDFEETIDISRKLLKKHSSFTIHSKLMDAHLYIFNKWVLDFLVHNKNLSTLKGELLPYVVNKQLQRPSKQTIDDKHTSIVKVDTRNDIFRFAIEKPIDELIRKMSAYNDHDTDLADAYHDDPIRCYAYTITGKFGLRANTVQMYSLANKLLSNLWVNDEAMDEISLPTPVSVSAVIKSTQMEDCRVADGAFIDEKTSLKHCHIGPSSSVHTKTRISDSVIMKNVTVGQRCVISNCILCKGCVIEEGTELKDCLVGAQHVVHAGSNHSREVLIDADRLMEI